MRLLPKEKDPMRPRKAKLLNVQGEGRGMQEERCAQKEGSADESRAGQAGRSRLQVQLGGEKKQKHKRSGRERRIVLINTRSQLEPRFEFTIESGRRLRVHRILPFLSIIIAFLYSIDRDQDQRRSARWNWAGRCLEC